VCGKSTARYVVKAWQGTWPKQGTVGGKSTGRGPKFHWVELPWNVTPQFYCVSFQFVSVQILEKSPEPGG